MLVDRGWGPQMFLKPVPKGPSQFPNMFLLTAHLGAFKLVDYPTLLHDGILVLWGYQQVTDCVVSSEMKLYSYFCITF